MRIQFNELSCDAWAEWKAKTNSVLCITTNGTLQKDGGIVTGAGIAQQATERFPDFNLYVGKLLKRYGHHCYVTPYGLVSFPVKFNWFEMADFHLMGCSFIELVKLIEFYQWSNVFLPRPGCGNGGRDWNDVAPLLKDIIGNFPFSRSVSQQLIDRITFVTSPKHEDHHERIGVKVTTDSSNIT
jgi:hypothetical protein